MTITLHPGSVPLKTLETIYWTGEAAKLDAAFDAGIEKAAAAHAAQHADKPLKAGGLRLRLLLEAAQHSRQQRGRAGCHRLLVHAQFAGDLLKAAEAAQRVDQICAHPHDSPAVEGQTIGRGGPPRKASDACK